VSDCVFSECDSAKTQPVIRKILVSNLPQLANSILSFRLNIVEALSSSRRLWFSAFLATVLEVDFDDSRMSRPAK
jgi:hypothetical protein